MIIAFSTRNLRQVCESESLAKKRLGTGDAEKLRNRLADIRAAKTVNDLLMGEPQKIDSRQLRLKLGDNYSLKLEANHPRLRVEDGQATDWSMVTRVKITMIEDRS